MGLPRGLSDQLGAGFLDLRRDGDYLRSLRGDFPGPIHQG